MTIPALSDNRRRVPAPKPSIVDAPALRQAFRVGMACAAAFAAYKLLGLKQGYWAVFAVLIVMQGSIGEFMTDRILEITLGGVIGVAAIALILPARSDTVFTGRAAAVLEDMGA